MNRTNSSFSTILLKIPIPLNITICAGSYLTGLHFPFIYSGYVPADMSVSDSKKRIITEQDCLREFYANIDEKQRTLDKWRQKNLDKHR